ncbi:hypothetical protein DOTSEDRAFT_55097 [Dothistroma septosporum NZE10]|uniref:Uncharacterized protein n=1 Tax=Dothistroma septosporum (strain NZE10 / CBS 128990) TaxID=675120 RepID=N1PI62_DOTSN|nr:hypothetical protein DOTSEDRAFT_55097 [Dothistroma septosporum NZE10]
MGTKLDPKSTEKLLWMQDALYAEDKESLKSTWGAKLMELCCQAGKIALGDPTALLDGLHDLTADNMVDSLASYFKHGAQDISEDSMQQKAQEAVQDKLKEKLEDKVVDELLQTENPHPIGVGLFQGEKLQKWVVDNKFKTRRNRCGMMISIAKGVFVFVTALLGGVAAGPALPALILVTAAAGLKYLDKQEVLNDRKRWLEIMGSMLAKYERILQKAQARREAKLLFEIAVEEVREKEEKRKKAIGDKTIMFYKVTRGKYVYSVPITKLDVERCNNFLVTYLGLKIESVRTYAMEDMCKYFARLSYYVEAWYEDNNFHHDLDDKEKAALKREIEDDRKDDEIKVAQESPASAVPTSNTASNQNLGTGENDKGASKVPASSTNASQNRGTASGVQGDAKAKAVPEMAPLQKNPGTKK